MYYSCEFCARRPKYASLAAPATTTTTTTKTLHGCSQRRSTPTTCCRWPFRADGLAIEPSACVRSMRKTPPPSWPWPYLAWQCDNGVDIDLLPALSSLVSLLSFFLFLSLFQSFWQSINHQLSLWKLLNGPLIVSSNSTICGCCHSVFFSLRIGIPWPNAYRSVPSLNSFRAQLMDRAVGRHLHFHSRSLDFHLQLVFAQSRPTVQGISRRPFPGLLPRGKRDKICLSYVTALLFGTFLLLLSTTRVMGVPPPILQRNLEQCSCDHQKQCQQRTEDEAVG